MFHIKVPATSANLGAGFDALGLALSLYNEVNFEESDQIAIRTLDHTMVPTDERNLIYDSVRKVYERCGKKLHGLLIEQINNIPITRGLGSSSACIVSGLLAGNLLLGEPLNLDDIVNLAAQLEGHPDNTTPALLGGIVTSVFDGNKVYYVRQEVDSHLEFVAIVPDYEFSTAAARQCLPKTVPFRDAVHNLSRAALFSSSLLTGKYDNLHVAVHDVLHQPYRIKCMQHVPEAIAFCDTAGSYATYLSGAGPTIISIVDQNNHDFVTNVRHYLSQQNLHWDVYSLTIDNDGAKVIY